jgi:hypothetical protein
MTEKPDKQLPHVREFVTAAGRYSISLISMGFEARRSGQGIDACPYNSKDDPDGVFWWMLGWHRCDRHYVAQGLPTLFKSGKRK